MASYKISLNTSSYKFLFSFITIISIQFLLSSNSINCLVANQDQTSPQSLSNLNPTSNIKKPNQKITNDPKDFLDGNGEESVIENKKLNSEGLNEIQGQERTTSLLNSYRIFKARFSSHKTHAKKRYYNKFYSRHRSSKKSDSSNKVRNLVSKAFSGKKTGDATFYGTGLGACGMTSSDSSMIAAASHLLFDTYPGATTDDPNNNPICGKKVKATYKGRTVEVEIVDKCEACNYNDLDFSPSAFEKIGTKEQGRLHGMTWDWA